MRTHTKRDKVPQITPSIKRQPLRPVGFRWIIPVLRTIHGVYRYDKLRRIRPPAKGVELRNMIDLESLHPLAPDSVTERTPDDSDVAKCLTKTSIGIHVIRPNKNRWVNGYPHPIGRRRESQLNRVQFNVATLNEEEEEEGTRENREQWESDVHDGYSIRI